ncbi:MAG: (Fe-S)-binding protein, partial [Clostridiales Family XIII bacterium]|nr:(Fe-S)-binding protein [Clostridiales Family XIII bacterium]
GSAAAGSVTGSAAAEELAAELAANTAPEDSAVDACIAEARRCPRCNCSACIDACTLIRHFKQNPKRIAADLGVTVLPVDEKIKHVASRMLNSCNICGLCTAVCPAGVDTCLAMYESRRILLRGGHLPAAYHSFWMDDMAFSMSEEAFAVVLPVPSALPVLSVGSESAGEKGETGRGLLFFPGCQLTASRPDTVSRTYEHIKTIAPNASMLLSCCGVPADWAGEEAIFESTSEKLRAAWEGLGRPEILYACSTCKKTFEKASPMVRGSLVYEWIAENGGGAARLPGDDARLPGGAMRACVYDPCSSRADKAGQAAVRELATRGGFVLDELGPSGETAACCGFGGHIYPANPTLLGEILAERTAASEVPYITYCANCNDLFLSEGKDSRHILDILFPSPSEEGLPSLTQRRENRRALKAKYAGLK